MSEKLFELTDKNGRDIKIIVTDDPYKHSHPIIKVESVEPIETKSEFKVPGWYCEKSDLCTMFYAVRSDDWYLFNDCGHPYDKCNFCSPTQEEIEAHLRKICDEKYLGKKIKSIYGTITNVTSFNQYRDKEDKMWYNGEHGLIVVYKQGEFAEIVPQEELKELPKTVEELKKLLQKFWEYEYKSYGIDVFLKEQGYKTT